MKRIFDIFLALFSLVLLGLPMIILAALITFKLGRPIIFSQIRPGINCRPFKMIKFRTMTDERDATGCLLEDSFRLTKFGCFIRSTSLDELPEIWNVLKGEMSFVGPRPLLMEYLPLYSDVQARRHAVRPGITGWAQVNGRNSIDWEEKFNLDVWYVDNHNIFLDIKILWLTLRKVFLRDGINSANNVTMSKFTGNNSGTIK